MRCAGENLRLCEACIGYWKRKNTMYLSVETGHAGEPEETKEELSGRKTERFCGLAGEII